jgi:TrmH family RNA methyltransferase
MLSKNRIKAVTALQQKKFRQQENLFLAEGEKVVGDLLQSGWPVKEIYGVIDYFNRLPGNIRIPPSTEMVVVTEDELQKLSTLTTAQCVLAVAEIPDHTAHINFEKGLKLVLDGISDPGNLGTLIRIADWFGIEEIICSLNTVDCYNPKVVQSTMGSLFHVRTFYMELSELFSENHDNKKLPVFGTVLNGKSVYEENLSANAFILVGNESAGISYELLCFITNEITIPPYSGSNAESLNVAVATGIVCAQFRQRK